jgi:hypothetical protein
VNFDTVQASTNVTGIINSDTTWTKANSPYTLTGPVKVNNGVTLTIEAGATVNLNSYYIQVDGTLFAKGSNADKIYFNDGYSGPGNYAITFTGSSVSWDEQTATGCLIENAVLSSTPIIINNASPKIYCNSFSGTLDYSIRIIGGSPVISNNIVTNTGILISGGGSSIVSNNTVINIGQRSGGYGIECSTDALISNNLVSGWMEYGGILTTSVFFSVGGFPIIERNIIINNAKGISIGILIRDWVGTTFPTIQNNTISKNSVGLTLGYEDQTGHGSPLQKILNNNFQDNSNYNFYLSDSSSNINATYNWWGTTDTQAINQTIYDFKNDFNLGTVDFVPFLTEPSPAAPIVPTFTISTSAGTGGSISPSGSVSVNYGGSQTFTVTANNGYQIVSVLMDGSPATAPYTFSNVVAAGHTISATFEALVIPEFPSWIILLLFILTTILVALVFRRKRYRYARIACSLSLSKQLLE